MQAYSDPKRESDPHALPDLEVWKHHHTTLGGCAKECAPLDDNGECRGAGWYWWVCKPGCLPDSKATGPFESGPAALMDARGWLDDDDESEV